MDYMDRPYGDLKLGGDALISRVFDIFVTRFAETNNYLIVCSMKSY